MISEIMKLELGPLENFFKFPDVWGLTSFISSFLLIIPGFIIIMHTCSEYTYRTHRQNIIDGLSRNQYVTSKILFVIVLALFSTILTAICAFCIGISGETAVSFHDFRYIYYFFIHAVMYLGLAFLFALLFRKAALTIGIFFVYSLPLENILERYLNKLNTGIDSIGHFLPLASSDHLLLFDRLKAAMNLMNMGAARPEYVYLTVSIAYIVLFGFICYYRYNKQDL
jgi:ABC-type transport system involved in multi-copper enzyme maturation permease subunit